MTNPRAGLQTLRIGEWPKPQRQASANCGRTLQAEFISQCPEGLCTTHPGEILGTPVIIGRRYKQVRGAGGLRLPVADDSQIKE
jgi:hypothetical protein